MKAILSRITHTIYFSPILVSITEVGEGPFEKISDKDPIV